MSNRTIKPSPLSTCTYYNEQGQLTTAHRMRRLQYKLDNNLFVPTALFTAYYNVFMAKLQEMNAQVKPAETNTNSELNPATIRF